MPMNWGRAPGNGRVSVDRGKCTTCGLCVKVCRGMPLFMADGEVKVDHGRLFGCIACGQCMTVCPTGAISVEGRDFRPSDVVEIPPSESRASYEALYARMLARRSVRDFQARSVERPVIQKILDAAATAPMGVPPSEVGVLVLSTPDRVAAFREDLMRFARSVRWMMSPAMLLLLRPLLGKDGVQAFHDFVVPVLDIYEQGDREGEDYFLYRAPMAMFFYGSRYADPADAIVAATNAMLAGEALGLGTCMLGFPGYMVKYGKRIRAKYELPDKLQPGVMVIFGYPDVQHRHAIRRRFAEVRWLGDD